jgi:glycerophosphoryl diester phosphodiesterase
MNWFSTYNIAHRGLHTDDHNVPENSMYAFIQAKAANYAMEFDVHITKDDYVVVFHDVDLKRMCGSDLRVEDSTYQEIKDFNLLGSSETIPLLVDVLKEINGAVPLLIEVKNTKYIDKIGQAILRALDDYKWAYAVQSFNPKIIHWFKENAPHIKRGLVAYDMKDSKESWINKMIIKHILLCPWVKPDFINYEHTSMPSKRLTKLQKKGITIIAWTVRSQEELDQVKQYYTNAVFELFTPR